MVGGVMSIIYKKFISIMFYMAGIFLLLNHQAVFAQINDTKPFRDIISIQGIREHQLALQEIASHHGNRMTITEGYRASVDYVKNQLESIGYDVQFQEFEIGLSDEHCPPVLIKMSPDQKVFQAGRDFSNMTAAGNLEINKEVEAIDLKIPSLAPNDSTSGCEKEDFKNFKPGNIALIQRGTCTFRVKVENAKFAGASGVIIFNEGNPGRIDAIDSNLPSSLANIAVLGASFAVGNSLRKNVLHGPTGIHVFMKVDVMINNHTVKNIIAETKEGDEARVVVVGAHLDSVIDGPGMNDNASGSATILEIAKKFAEMSYVSHNKLRFIWFGAEEFGLLGSEFYVNSLTEDEKKQILAMLNFDMLGSSNYARFVYDGDNSSKVKTMAQAGPEGSGHIENIFLDYFLSLGLASHPTAFDGRSDYGPFIEAEIPAGGLFSGAEGRKSSDLAQIYGGIAGVAFDPCYHQACDDFTHTGGNEDTSLALKSLDELSDAAAHAVLTLANSTANIRPKKDKLYKTKIELEYKGDLLIR
jgi:Zn-dependent M28 family amino/carboxypeptidase